MNWSGGVQWEYRTISSGSDLPGFGGRGVVEQLGHQCGSAQRIASDYATLDNIRRNVQNFKPYPQFGSIQLYSNFGHNTYHSGTVRVERRYRNGLFANGFYTLSKNLTDADADGGASGVTYYNRRLEKARSNFDISHRFVGTFIYELPYGKGRRLGNHGGSRTSSSAAGTSCSRKRMQSGPPITVTFAGAPSTPYAPGQPYVWLPGQLRPNQILPNDQAQTQNWTIGPNRLPTSAQNPYLNAAAFAYPAPFTPGTLGRNTLTSPGIIWAQTSLVQDMGAAGTRANSRSAGI